ncbi:MAG TPA: hypothetical protein VK808_06680 [Bacteroidia bacterium]|jgi:hypothetical protein|nr:hypothetical protein [Bacteroidia bacterium]
MNKSIWNFISYIFHPALMPTLGTFVVLWCDPNLYIPLDSNKPWFVILVVVFLCTYLLPLILAWMLLKLGRVSSITQPTENDRRVLLSFTALCFILIYYSFHTIPTSGQSLKIFMLGINISIVSTLIISLFTKVSFHSVGVGGLLGTVIGLMRYTQTHLLPWFMAALALVLLVGLARYKLKAHGAFEIYLGLIIGIASQALVFFFATYGF